MIALEVLIKLNAKPKTRRDNFNRDSSYVESSQGFVIHSGIHRSTAFISKQDHADGYFAFQYWKEQGQQAMNGFIELTIDGATLETCESEAFHRSRPDWITHRNKGTGKNRGQGEITARRKSGACVESIGAFSWRHLHAKTADKDPTIEKAKRDARLDAFERDRLPVKRK